MRNLLVSLLVGAGAAAAWAGGELVPVRSPGAVGVRAKLAAMAVAATARLDVLSSSGVVYQVLGAAELAHGVEVPVVPEGAAEAERWLDGDTLWLRMRDAGPAKLEVERVLAQPGHEWSSALAARWAPHVFQDTDKAGARFDLLAAFDFDGNFNGDDNWAHAGEAREYPLGGRPENQAAVYWYAAESSTHAFVGYGLFHPRDWDHLPWFGQEKREHVNDMEGALVCVRRSTGRPEMLVTVNHHDFHQYALVPTLWGLRDRVTGAPTNDPKKAREVVEGVLQVRDGHPVIYIEAQGHGVTGRPFEHWMRGPNYDGVKGDGVHYAPGTYALKSIAPLWRMAHAPEWIGPGRAFHDRDHFQGETHGTKNSANPPWGWNHAPLAGEGWSGGAGSLFFDPGGLLAFQFVPPAPFDPILVRRSWEPVVR